MTLIRRHIKRQAKARELWNSGIKGSQFAEDITNELIRLEVSVHTKKTKHKGLIVEDQNKVQSRTKLVDIYDAFFYSICEADILLKRLKMIEKGKISIDNEDSDDYVWNIIHDVEMYKR